MEKRIKQNLENFLDLMPIYTVKADGIYRDTAETVIEKIEGKKTAKKTKTKTK